MNNYYHILKKSYANDIALCNEFFKDKITEMVNRRHTSIRWHYWDPVTNEIANTLNTQLELFNDMADCNLIIHHVNLFICKEGVVGGLHIDSASWPRHCSLNLPLSGCEDSEIMWVRPDQYEVGMVDQRNGARAGFPVGADLNDPTDWDIVDSTNFGRTTLIKTDTWHAIDNRKNSLPRVTLAFRLLGNPEYSWVLEQLDKKGLIEEA